VRKEIRADSWRFPANLSIAELEERLRERLLTQYELADVEITMDREGRAEIAAAPTAGGLSRRVPDGKRAVSIETILPTGLARGDRVSITLPDGTVTGPVVSARTFDSEQSVSDASKRDDEESDEQSEGVDSNDTDETHPAPELKAPRTDGGRGQVTVVLPFTEARRVIRADFAPVRVHFRGTQREYESIGLLKQHGNRFERITVQEGSPLAGATLASIDTGDSGDVVVLAIRRAADRIIAPGGTTRIQSGDALIVAGKHERVRSFREAVA
jgi:hypothetical protein